MGYKDPEKAAAYAREWRVNHADKVLEDDRKRREEERKKDPFAATERTRKWRAVNPEKVQVQASQQNERQKLRRKIDPIFKGKQCGYDKKYLAKPGTRERRNQYTKEWHKARRAEDPAHYREASLKCLYGITLEQYAGMVAAQNGRCAICHTDKPGGKHKNWHVDHCHGHGQIRELLCHACNTGLGLFKDKPELLLAAAAYLKKHQ